MAGETMAGETMGKNVRLDELPKLAPTARQLYLGPTHRDPEIETELERRFFAGLRLRSGVFKSTDAGRLEELDDLVAGHLAVDRPLHLMDVAVSSGVTTADWMASLDRAGIEHNMLASDLCIEAWLLSSGRHLHVLVDRSGFPLQYEIFGRGVRGSSGRALISPPLSLMRQVVQKCTARHQAWAEDRKAHPEGRELSSPQRATTLTPGLSRVLLISRRLSVRANLSLLEEDLLAPPPADLLRRFHAVRAANILSRSYFTDDQLRHMIGNLKSRLLPGGLLIVCRTEDDGTNNGTIFRLGDDNTFQAVSDLGGGLDVRDLVLTGTS